MALIPTQAQIDFFVRWSQAARREDRVVDASLSMEQRLDEAARLERARERVAGRGGAVVRRRCSIRVS